MMPSCVKSHVWLTGSQDNALLTVFWAQAGGAAGPVHEGSSAAGRVPAPGEGPDQVREAEPIHGRETRYVTAGPIPLRKEAFDKELLCY